ncbi:MAG TPA: hypothetical protein VEH00_08365 [Steroidobacteraceae bacterium]|nr:hypothetical protein [Steroidobacteraceae bacterium]
MKALMKVSLLALAALWAGAALAGPGGGNQASHMEKLAILLDLTDAQKPQVQTILQGEHQQMKALFDQAKAAGGGQPDVQSLHAAGQQIHQDTLTKLSGVLSPVQLKKFQTLQQMHHGFGGRRGPPAGAPAAPSN